MTIQYRRRTAAVVVSLGLVAIIAVAATLTIMSQRSFSAHDEPSWIEAKLARTMRGWAIPAKAKKLVNPIRFTPEALAEGRAHWAEHCAICHANNGSGDTPIGRNLYPKPPDMRKALTQNLTDGELYYIIQNGIRLSGMPAWGDRDVKDDEHSWALVGLIRNLPKLRPNELKEMEKMNPKSLQEWREAQEQEDFPSKNDDAPPAHQHRHNHNN